MVQMQRGFQQNPRSSYRHTVRILSEIHQFLQTAVPIVAAKTVAKLAEPWQILHVAQNCGHRQLAILVLRRGRA
jgi:hypothetical protein